jgi:hypothetical protein
VSFCIEGMRAIPTDSKVSSIVSFSFLIDPSKVSACAFADPQNSLASSARISF